MNKLAKLLIQAERMKKIQFNGYQFLNQSLQGWQTS